MLNSAVHTVTTTFYRVKLSKHALGGKRPCQNLNVKVKFAINRPRRLRVGGEEYLYSFFNLGDRVGWSEQRPCPFIPGESTPYRLYKRLGGPQDRYVLVRKISPPPWIILSLCTLSVLVSLSWVSWLFPFVLTAQHTQHKHPCPRRDSKPQPQQAIGRRP